MTPPMAAADPQRSPLKGRNSFLRSLRMRAAEGDAGPAPASLNPAPAPGPAHVVPQQAVHCKAMTAADGVPDAVTAKLAAAHLTPDGFRALAPVTANGHNVGSRQAATAADARTAVLGLPAEEEAFLRSLGWSEGAGGEDGGLTDAEIAAYRVRHSFAVR